jgi:hypothetical protein
MRWALLALLTTAFVLQVLGGRLAGAGGSAGVTPSSARIPSPSRSSCHRQRSRWDSARLRTP